MRFDPNVIRRIANTWEDARTQELIRALVSDIEKRGRHTVNQQDKAFLANLAAQVQDPIFWENVDTMLQINLDF